MTELIQDGYGIQAQDINQLLRGSAYSVIDGCEVTPSDTDMAVHVASGDIRFDGSTVSVDEQIEVPLDSPDDNPRKDILFVDGNGEAQTLAGIPEPAQPEGQTGRETYRPSPPDTANTDAVVLAEIWVPANAADITTSDISDRRRLVGSDNDSSITGSLSVQKWNMTDVSNHGFSGDRSGGDLAQFIADNTSAGSYDVFILPDGTYNWNRAVRFTNGSGVHHEEVPGGFALIGKPQATLHVSIDPSLSPRGRICFDFGGQGAPIDEVIVKNIHVDVGDANQDRDAGFARCQISSKGLFEDITMTRRHRLDPDNPSSEQNGDRYTFLVNCVEDTASAKMKRFILSEGDEHVSDSDSVGHAIPFASEPEHVGKNIWEECYAEEFTDNGFYVRDGPGTNHLRNCATRNCSAGSFRLGVNDYAENISIWVDNPSFNATPLWIEEHRDGSPYEVGSEADKPIIVDGFEIYTSDSNTNDVVRVMRDVPEVVLKNGYIRNETDSFVLDFTQDSGKVSVENVTIDDHATGNVRVAANRFHADNINVDNLTYRPYPPEGAEGRSIMSIDGTRVTIENSDLHGTYVPAVETYAGADFTIKDSAFPHDGSYSDPYFMRNNGSNSVENIVLRHNDLSDYGTRGLGLDTETDVNTHLLFGNDGLTDNLGSEIRMTGVDGYYDGLLMGGDLSEQTAYSHRNATGATIYSLDESADPGFSFRNHGSGGDMFTVDNETGDGWFRGGLRIGGSGGLILPDVSGGNYPGGTEAGRMVYDSSREE